MTEEPTVFVVDDDPAARESVSNLIHMRGLAVECYESAERFLQGFDRARLGCLVTDLRMTGMSGLDLLEELRKERIAIPAIIITAYGNVPSAVRAMRDGALVFLEKPCQPDDLWQNICEAIDLHRSMRSETIQRAEVKASHETLSGSERTVMDKMVAGVPNKVIAVDLDMGLRTVELRRANILKKMHAKSVAELVRMSMEID